MNLPSDNALITAYGELRKPLDPLAYTPLFDHLLIRAGVIPKPIVVASDHDLALMASAWQRYQYLRKRGFLPTVARGH